jgi:hypothetical protein
MSTIKNGDVGILDTMDEIHWSEEQDITYYTDIHGDDAGECDRRDYMVRCIECSLSKSVETLDHAIEFLWRQHQALNIDALSPLSIEGKIALLRYLILDRSNDIRVASRMQYITRFEKVFAQYKQAQQLRDKVLQRYLLEPSKTWLREYVDAYDATFGAWLLLDEAMSCEHSGYRDLLYSNAQNPDEPEDKACTGSRRPPPTDL